MWRDLSAELAYLTQKVISTNDHGYEYWLAVCPFDLTASEQEYLLRCLIAQFEPTE